MIRIDLNEGEGVLIVKGSTEDLLNEWGKITEQIARVARKSTETDETAKFVMKKIFKCARNEGIKLAKEED